MTDIYDMVIIGGGPAGLAAGLYAARARLKVVLVEKMGFGGQLLTYEKVENYPGFPEGIGAYALSELMSAQALKFGLHTVNGEVTALEVGDVVKTVHLADGAFQTRTLVIASGASPNQLGVPGETEYTGRGVSYCAVCDAPFFRDQEVAVIGGGDTAIEEALYLTKFARRVHVVHRRDRLRATPIIQEKAFDNERISFMFNTVVRGIQGDGQGLTGLALEEKTGKGRTTLSVDGVFVFVGLHPNTDWLPDSIGRDASGFLPTDQEMATAVPGIFAAGDVRVKELRQIVTAVADGATAAFNAGRYIEAHFSMKPSSV
jgi:thioredoxin reductase (NADPH)